MVSEIRDRLEALRRNPEYRKDFVAWNKLLVSMKKAKATEPQLASLKTLEGRMTEKWNVPSPFPPLPSIPIAKWNRYRFQYPLTDLPPITVIDPAAADKQGILGRLEPRYDPLRVEADYKSFSQEHAKRKVVYRGGAHLCIIIDLSRTQEALAKEFKAVLQYYKRVFPGRTQGTRRKPTTTVDIWRVYDEHKKGYSLSAITRRLMPQFTVPDDVEHANYQYLAKLSAVRRGIKKAERLVKAAAQR